MTEQQRYALPAEPLPVRLMNTLRAERGALHDDLSDTDQVIAWLRSAGMETASVTADDAREVRELRDAVRGIAAFVTHDERGASVGADGIDAALRVLNAHAVRAPQEPLVLVARTLQRNEPKKFGSARDAMSALAVKSVRFFAEPESGALRACQGPRCVLYFVQDHPRREWCDGLCGGRARAARYYRRHRQEPAHEATGSEAGRSLR